MSRIRVLVLSNKVDVHTDSVIDRLYRNDADVVRLNTEDFRDNKYDLSIHDDGVSLYFSTPEGRVITVKNIDSVYVRRITAIHVGDVDNEYKQFVRDESQVLLDSFHMIFSGAKWLDPPHNRVWVHSNSKCNTCLFIEYLIRGLPAKSFSRSGVN